MRYLVFLLLATCYSVVRADWFEEIKSTASNEQLYQLLYEMPKGADLHLHMSGSGFSEWWYELALDSKQHGYEYYTKVRINNCVVPGTEGFEQYLLHYQNILAARWQQLDECQQGEYIPLAELSEAQKAGWMDAIRLDKPHEGRNEFFETHWQRLGDLNADPHAAFGNILKNFEAFADEGLLYIEPQVAPLGYVKPDLTPIDPIEYASWLNAQLASADVPLDYQFQLSILRFVPNAEEHLKLAYQFVAGVDPWVAVNMVGREDDDKGYPLRFLPTLRELRQTNGNVRLSIHAGEVDEPNSHVKDTLLLGADRIGHGVNLITDPDTMRLMRHGPYLVEINLISNLLLEYVQTYDQHPFPEYLRTGIPVALSTDDRGMWDSTMTDEFYVATREFNLSWNEIKTLSRNSLKYSFLPADRKAKLLQQLNANLSEFESRMQRTGLEHNAAKAVPKRGFICRHYQICSN